ncbi:hypothetical protein ACFL2V_08370 [Pseudomonadota bacterium]
MINVIINKTPKKGKEQLSFYKEKKVVIGTSSRNLLLAALDLLYPLRFSLEKTQIGLDQEASQKAPTISILAPFNFEPALIPKCWRLTHL